MSYKGCFPNIEGGDRRMIGLAELLESNFNSSDYAVIQNDVSYTYRQFGEVVHIYEEYYLKNNIKRVMLCLPQSFMAYAAMVAAYLTKTIYCPIDIDAPLVRKEYFIKKYQPDLILTVKGIQLPEYILDLVRDVEDFCWVESNNATNLKLQKEQIAFEARKNEVAYVIFTSGSTGYPKGVSVPRKALENFVQFGLDEYKITNKDLWGQFSKLSFDLSTFDVFVATAGRATLVPIASKGHKLLPARMIDKYQITYWHSVPSVMDLINFDLLKEGSLQSLRILNFAGEVLLANTVEKLFLANNNIKIYNVFGHTETTFAMYQKLEYHDYKKYLDSTVSIGKPIPNYKVYLQNVQDGIGEIVISGFIADGYLGEPNSKMFREIEKDGAVEYSFLSGDYGYYQGENLYFWGRTDTQIKHNGNRIDLNEIDNAFRMLGYISTSVFYQNRIIVFVFKTDAAVDTIIGQLEMYLPEYYIPQRICIMQDIPYNSSNKIDRNALIEILEKQNDRNSKRSN